jgi:glutamate racemase
MEGRKIFLIENYWAERFINMHKSPIGIFDSGVGGLTIAHAVKQLLPNEQIVYFGDTAHMPYGDKSAESIISYSKSITEFLLSQNCKIIVIACNTASAHAYEEVKMYLLKRKSDVLLVDVINPVAEYVAKNFSSKKVGIIGTKGTIQSNVYENKLKQLNPSVKTFSIATALFASMIEEGFINNAVSKALIKQYLSDPGFNDIDAIILGCTHYPLIKEEINDFFEDSVEVIDSAALVAHYLRNRMKELNLISKTASIDENIFYVSDYTTSFEKVANQFFKQKIQLQLAQIWK